MNTTGKRHDMVKHQLEERGIRSRHVLDAMREVPREEFVAPSVKESAYADAALPIAEGQTISQPFIVALMLASAGVGPGTRVLEVGTGSGYAAAVAARIAEAVYTVERHAPLAEGARRRLDSLGYKNVHVRIGDGTLGWPEHAPYDAILVAAGGPQVPEALIEQLAVGGRLIIPVGELGNQTLRRITRHEDGTFTDENAGPVAFVPLIGQQGWQGDNVPETGEAPSGAAPDRPAQTVSSESAPERAGVLARPETVAGLIARSAEPLLDIDNDNLATLLERIGGSRVVLIGEATHGTSEFYRMRARITKELISRRGFNIVGIEADWPDASRVDHYIRAIESTRSPYGIFSRFPTWMWRNVEVLQFVEWLREHNASLPDEQRTGFFGLDLYSLNASIREVLNYLEKIDPELAQVAHRRYGCLAPFWTEPADYGHATLTGRYEGCEQDVNRMLSDLLKKRLEYIREGPDSFLDATQNAQIVANAEKYYRVMYFGSAEAWNLRDGHMFSTLESLLSHYGPSARAVVWAHNSHVGDASATEMYNRGEVNIGYLSRQRWGEEAYIVGFGTHHGTVAAAPNWGEDVEIMSVRPSHANSYEHLCHESGVPAFMLHLRQPRDAAVHEELKEERLERAIGVIYRPDTELMSHYFQASLPQQFDEYIWFDESRAVTPIGPSHAPQLSEAHPFALLDE